MNQTKEHSYLRVPNSGMLGGIGRAARNTRVASANEIAEKIAAESMEAGRIECGELRAQFDNGEILTLINNNLDAIHNIQGAFSNHLERISPILGLNRPEVASKQSNDQCQPSMASSIGDRLMHQNILLAQLLDSISQATDLVAL